MLEDGLIEEIAGRPAADADERRRYYRLTRDGRETARQEMARMGLRFALTGIVLGLSAAVVAGDRIRTLLFEVDARDPATFAVVAVAVLLVAAAASYGPARRAATSDPLVVLQSE
jgi:hypothetical protein